MPAKTNPGDIWVRELAKGQGLTDAETQRFGREVELAKKEGDVGTLNKRGDFTRDQLSRLLEEFMRSNNIRGKK